MYSRTSKLLMAVIVLFGCMSVAVAGSSEQWAISLESTGDGVGNDAVWNSATAVNPSYKAYFYECDFTTVEVLLTMPDQDPVWFDYSPAFNPTSHGGAYDGIGFDVYNNVYDANELSLSLSIVIDEDGYASAQLTNVTFDEPWLNATVSGIRLNGTLKVNGIKELWTDTFDYGTTQMMIGDTDAWSTNGWELEYVSSSGWLQSRAMYVGGDNGGKAYLRDTHWGGYVDEYEKVPKIALADGVQTNYNDGTAQQDYIVKVAAYKTPVVDSQWNTIFYLRGRNADPNYIDLEVAWGPYQEQLFARLSDANGDGYMEEDESGVPSLAYVYIADVNPNLPIYMELKMIGDQVTGIVSHNGSKTVLKYTTNVINSGAPGIGGYWPYGYMYGLFDNFGIYSAEAIEPTQCGEQGTYYLDGDINEDCQIDVADLKEMASHWLENLN